MKGIKDYKIIDSVAYRHGMEKLCVLYGDIGNDELTPELIQEKIIEAVRLIENGVKINKDSYPYTSKMKDNIKWTYV